MTELTDSPPAGDVAPARDPAPVGTAVTAEQFVVNLLRDAITCERVAAVVARVAGERIQVGPLRVGPGGAATANGFGVIGPVKVTPAPGPLLGFEASIPAELTIDISAGGPAHRFLGDVVVPLHIQTVLEAPTCALLDVATLGPPEVSVELRVSAMMAMILQTLGNANGEVAEQVALVVNRRVAEVVGLRRINLADLIDRGWNEGMAAQLAG
ncbi:MAG: hypothetical protein ACRDZ8_17390 [Acidimicrobiales bacterium]